MKSLTLWSLIVLNVVLGMALLAKYGKENTAIAQVGKAADYLMVPGSFASSSNPYLFIVDTTNGQLGGLSFDTTNSRFDILQPIDLNRLFDQSAIQNNNTGGPQRGNIRR